MLFNSLYRHLVTDESPPSSMCSLHEKTLTSSSTSKAYSSRVQRWCANNTGKDSLMITENVRLNISADITKLFSLNFHYTTWPLEAGKSKDKLSGNSDTVHVLLSSLVRCIRILLLLLCCLVRNMSCSLHLLNCHYHPTCLTKVIVRISNQILI